MVVWGGLHPIREQLLYDICTIIGWIYITTIVIRQSISIMTMSTNRKGMVRINHKSNNDSSNRNENDDHQSKTYSTWYVTLLVFISCVGTILITSRGTITTRWTMTLPMIPLVLLYSAIYILSLYHQHQRRPQSNQSMNISIYVKFIYGILSFLCIICILVAILLSVLFPAVELPPVINSTNHDNLYPTIGVIDFYIPLPSYNHANITTTAITTIQIDGNNSCSVSPTTDESSCIIQDSIQNLTAEETTQKQKYLPVRLLYPTNYVHPKEWSISNNIRSMLNWILQYLMNYPNQNTYTDFKSFIPYLNIKTAKEFCEHSMRLGAPDLINEMGWILHTWRLITLPLLQNVPLILQNNDNNTISLPFVVYSHGLGGSLDLYSYQAMSLAVNGYLVLLMTHTDGTAPITVQPDPNPNHIVYDTTVLPLHYAKKFKQYDDKRQHQNRIRVFEYIHAVEYIHNLLSNIHINKDIIHQPNNSTNVHNNNDDDSHQPSHHRRMIRQSWELNTSTKVHINGTYFMGHSFGGATVLQAAYNRPDLVSAIVAHEPAIDWMAPNVCHSLFPHHVLHDIDYNDTICPNSDTHNNNNDPNTSNNFTIQNISKSLHDKFDMLILNSNDWFNNKWGRVELLQKMFQQQKIGKHVNISSHRIIYQSYHLEFSDTSMITPLWLARSFGLTGPRNPIHTAQEIAHQTLDFLHRVRHVHESK